MAYDNATESMITKVQKKKELSRNDAIAYMLTVATGRLSALWRYSDTLPEGKQSKGVYELKGKKKPAERAGAKKPAKAKKEPKAAAPAAS